MDSKVSSRGRQSFRRGDSGGLPPLTPIRLAVLAALGVTPAAQANQIVTDGRTGTAVTVDGNTTDIRTDTTRGLNAFNSFRHFRVVQGNTVNLHLPGGTENLINLVHDSRAVIDGTLNGVLDGRIGGHIVFADPHGVVVGANGVLNVGSLLLTTPTSDFLDQVVAPDGSIGEAAVERLLAGEAPVSADGIVQIDGTVNTAGAIAIQGTDVAVTGSLRSASPAARQALFEAAVNTDGIEAGSAVSVSGGEIAIRAGGDVRLDGELEVTGDAADGGSIRVRAGQDVVVGGGAHLDAAGGTGATDGGSIDVWADRDGRLESGARLDASAGDVGDGGFIEFSSRRRVEVAPVSVDVSGAGGGDSGLFYIDPEEIILTAGDYRSGDAGGVGGFTWVSGDALLEASGSITLQDGAVINSRQVTGGKDPDLGSTASIGHSGNITLRAPTIELQQGSKLLAFANNGYAAGDITLEAVQEIAAADYLVSDSAANARIDVDGLLRGGNIDLRAVAAVTAEPADPVADLVGALPTAFQNEYDALTPDLPDIGFAYADAEVNAVVDVGASAELQATGDITLSAEATRSATVTAGADGAGAAASAALGWLGGETRVGVAEGAVIDAGGALALRAESSNTLAVTADTAVGDLSGLGLGGSVALGFVDVTTEVSLDAAADAVSANAVSLQASSSDSFDVASTMQAAADGTVGISAAVLDAETTTRARLAGEIDTSGDISVVADSRVSSATSRAVTGTSAAAAAGEEHASGSWTGFFTGLMGKADSASSEVAADDGSGGEASETPGGGSGGGLPFDFGSAMSLLWLDDTTEAVVAADPVTLDASASQLSGRDVTVAARRRLDRLANQAVANTASAAEQADGSGGSTAITLSAAVAFADVDERTRALIGDGAVVTAERLGVGAELALPAAVDWGADGEPGSLADLEGAGEQDLADWTTSHAAASAAGSDTLSLAGAFSGLLLDSRVEAGIGDNADVTVSGAGGAWNSTVGALDPYAWADTVSIRGAAAIGTLSLAGNGAGGEGVGVGGAVNWDRRYTRVSAGVGSGSSIQAGLGATDAGLAVSAERDERQIAATSASGEAGGSAGLGAALALGQLDAAASAQVDAATVADFARVGVASGSLSEHAVLVASRITAGNVGLAATAAVANLDSADQAGLDSTVSGAGTVSVSARGERSHEVRAYAETTGKTALGIAAAIADVTAGVTTELAGSVAASGNVTGYARADSTASTVIAETAVKPGESQPAQDPDDPEANVDGEVAEKDGGSTSFIQGRADAKAGAVDSKAGQGTGSGSSGAQLKLGAAIALSDVDADAAALVADGADVTTAGDIALAARLRDQAVRTQARAGARSRVKNQDSGTAVAAAGAVALDFRDNAAAAIVGQGVSLEGARVGIGADAAMPLSAPLGWGDFLALKDLYEEFKTGGGTPLTDKVRKAARGYASATVQAGSGDVGLSGSVNYGEVNTDARAWLGDGSSITATGSLDTVDGAPGWTADLGAGQSWSWREVAAVTAVTDTRSLEIAGNLDSLFSGSTGAGAKALMGGSFNWVDRGGETIAGIGADAVVQADSVGVRADRFDQVVAVTPGSGKGAGVTGTGMVSFTRIGGVSHASLSNSAEVTAGSLAIDAGHGLSLWSVAGAVSRGENVGVGVALAVNDLQSDTAAWIGDNSADAPGAESADSAGRIRADGVNVTASSHGSVASAAVAGAQAAQSSGSGGLTGKAGGATQSRTSGAESRASTTASQDDPALSESQGAASDKSAWSDGSGSQGSQPANSDSSKSNKGKIGLAVAGGATVNLAALTTRAEIDGADIAGRSGGPVDVTLRAITDADMLGFAGGGALTRGGGGGSGFKAALAGSLAFNHLQNSTRAALTNSTLTGADDIAVEAMTAGDQIAAGIGVAITAGAKNGMSAAGSASIGYVANQTYAGITDSTLADVQGALGVTAYDRTRIANGGGALALGGKAGVGAAVTVGLVENTLQAEIDGGSVDGAESVAVSALSGTRVFGGAAMASAVTGGQGVAASGAAVYNQVANSVSARIHGGAAIGAGSGVDPVGGVSVQAAGTDGVAGLDALVAARADDAGTQFDLSALFDPNAGDGRSDPTEGNDPGAGYDAGAPTDVGAPAGNGEVVVGIAGNVSLGGAASLGLSFVGNFVNSTYDAAVSDAVVDTGGAASVRASDSALVAGLAVGASASSGKFAGMGSVTVNRIASRADASVGEAAAGRTTLDAASLEVNGDKAADIYALAGSVAFAGKAGVGLSVGYNEIANSISAGIDNADVTLSGDAAVAADSDAAIYSAAVSGAASGGVALGGSVNINRVGQTVSAGVRDATVDAAGLDVHAGDTDGASGADIWALAGDIKGGGKAAVGVSLASNFITSDYSATIDGAGLTLTDRLDLRARSAGNIRTLGVSGGAGGKLAAGAAVATGDFDATTRATLRDSSLDGETADVLVAAADDSQIQTFSASLQVGGFAGAAGAATVNTLDNEVSAAVDGAAGGKQIHARNLVVEARSEADARTIAMGAAGGGKAGLSGSVATSILRTATDAGIRGGADILAEGNVGVFARSDDAIGVAAGSVGIGGVAVGAAGSVSVNILENDTQAAIQGATTRVRARQATGETLTASTGALASTPSGNPFAEIFDVEAGSEDSQPSAEDFAGYSAPTLGGASREVGGVVVDALSLQQADAALASVGVSANVIKGGAGLAGAVNTTVMAGETRALVEDATIGDPADREAYGDLTVVSGHHSYGTSVVLGLAAGSEGAMGATTVDSFSGRSVAAVRDAAVHSRGNVDIDAVSSRGLLGVAAGAAIGTYVGAAGSGGVTVFGGETLAEVIGNSVLRADRVDVHADSDSRQQLVAAGFAGSGGVAAAGTFAVALSESVTTARIGDGSSARPDLNTYDGVTVDADSRTEIDNTVASAAAAGGASLAGAVSTPIILNRTTASIRKADLTTGGDVTVDALDTLRLDSAAGGGAFSLNAAGAVGVNVGVVKSQTLAELVDSDVTADDVTVSAERDADLDLDTFLASVGLQGGALSGGIGVLVLGEALENDVSDQTQANLGDELGSGGGDWLGKGSDFSQQDHLSGDGDRTEGTLDGEGTDYGTIGAVDLGAKVYDSAADSTTARIEGGEVTAGAVRVAATDRTATSNRVGSFAVGLQGIGGAAAVTQVNSGVLARTAGSDLEVGRLDIDALSSNGAGKAVDVEAITGAAGVVGMGAAVAVGMYDGSVTAELGGTVRSNGVIEVDAEDRAEVTAEGLGANLGLTAAGVVLAVADRDGRVDARADGAHVLRGGSLGLQADARGATYAKSVSAAGGLGVAAQAGGAFARERTAVTAEIRQDNVIEVGGAVQVQGTAVPRSRAEAYGASVAGNVGIGAAIADAASDNTVRARIRNGASVEAGRIDILGRALVPSGTSSAYAKAVAGSGGLLAGANATVARARSSNDVAGMLEYGAEVASNGRVSVQANNHSEQDAVATGISLGGILALGAAVAQADSDARTTAALDGTVEGRSSGRSPSRVEVRAYGEDDNYADATSGSGGTIAAAAALATTDNDSDTGAYIHRSGAAGGHTLEAGTVVLDAHHVARFNGVADSFQAAVAGMSGAIARNTVDAGVLAEFGAGARVEALSLLGSANNRIIKSRLGDFNAQAASGGAFTGAAVGSYTTVVQDTDLRVGDGAVLTVSGDYRNPGLFDLTAYNELYLRDRSRLDTGGAISVALAESKFDVQRSRADVTVGNNARLDSVGDIALAGWAAVDMLSQANAKTYGAAAAASGDSVSRIAASQTVTVESGADLRSDGSIYLMAGRNAAGNSNDFEVLARTDVYNKTAVPISDIAALADVDQDANVRVDGGATVRSVRDVHLLAVEGGIGASGIATGTDLYREALEDLGKVFSPDTEMSLDIRKGDSEWSIDRGVRVDGRVETGIQNHQYATFDWDDHGDDDPETGTLLFEGSDGVTYRVIDQRIAQSMQERLDELYRLKAEYSGHPTLPAIYQAEINQIQQRLQDFGARVYQIKNHAGEIIGVSVESDIRVRAIDLAPMLAAPGDIFVEGDTLTGSGALIAPGDASIEVTNNSPYFLQIQGLEIPDYKAGRVLFNRSSVNSNAELNALQGATAAFSTFETAENTPDPHITVRNTYNPASAGGEDSYLAPDIYVVGDIDNLLGDVSLSNAAGSVVVGGDISAKDLAISAGRDVVMSYTEGFRHLGGDPKGQWNDFAEHMQGGKGFYYTEGCEAGYYCWDTVEWQLANPDDPLSGRFVEVTHKQPIVEPDAGDGPVVAANNVFISGRYLNINGTVQSGIPDWDIDLGSGLNSKISAAEATFNARGGAGNHLFEIASWREGKVKAWWNARLDRIELDGVKVEGGYMELLGEIMSTGEGKLKVLDGFGRIDIDNDTGRELVLNGLDVGQGVEGTIRITDLGKTNAHGDALVTVYKRIGNEIRVYDNDSVDALGNPTHRIDTASGRSGVSYSPQQGLRYNWVRGQNKTEKEWRRWEKASKTFFDLFSLSWLVPDDYSDYTDSETWENGRDMLEGDYLQHGGGSREYSYDYDEIETAQWDEWGNWRTDDYCSKHFIGCVERTYWAEATRERGLKDFHFHSVRADHDVGIEFIGYDQGLIDVLSDGGLLINGRIYNPEGDTRLRADFIRRISDDATIWSDDLSLTASHGIGGDRAILTGLSGALTATTSYGDIVLDNVDGGLRVNRVVASRGDVDLAAQDGLVMAGGGSGHYIRGREVSLTARQGGIGSAGAAVNIDTAGGEAGLLRAEAGGGIYLHELAGDLRLETVTAAQDVVISTADGRIMDANTAETRDERTEAELLALWDELDLTGADAEASADAMVEAYARGKEGEYRQYWRLRNVRQEGGRWVADDYDPDYSFSFSADQAARLKQELGLSDLSDLEQARTEQYHALHQDFGGLSYDPAYDYQVSSAERAELTQGAVWTENQLKYSIGRGMLGGTSDTDTRIEDPNIVGRNVTLTAGGPSIGSTLAADVVIDLTGPLTDAERLALASAEKDDLQFDGDIVRVTQREDLDVHASGDITASAVQEIFLGGEQDINVTDIASPVVRIKGARSIIGSRGDGPVIRADDLTLEAGSGSIDGAGGGLHVAVGNELAARADGALRLIQHGGDLNLLEFFAGGNGAIDVLDGGLFQRGSGLTLQAADLALDVRDGVGALGAPLNLQLSGSLTGTVGGDLFLATPGSTLTLGDLTVGGLAQVAASGAVTVDGQLQAGDDVDLSGGDRLALAASAAIDSAAGSVALSGHDLVMGSGSSVTAADRADLSATDGDAVLARVSAGATGDAALRVVAGGAIRAAAGDHGLASAGGATLSAATAIGAADARIALEAPRLDASAAGGSAYLLLRDPVTAARVDAAGDADLQALQGLAFQGLTAGGDLRVTGAAAVSGDSATAGGRASFDAASLDLGTVTVNGGDLLLEADGAAAADRLRVASGHLTVAAGSAELTDAEASGRIRVTTSGGQSLGTLTSGAETELTSVAGDIGYGSLTSGTSLDVDAGGDVTGGTATAAAAVTVDGARVDLTTTTSTGAGVQLTSSGDTTLGSVSAADGVDLNAGGDLDYAEVTTGSTLQAVAGGTVTGAQATAGGLAVLDGAALDLGSVRSTGGDVRLTATTGATAASLLADAGDIAVDSGSAQLDLATAAGTLRVTTSGHQGHGRLSSGLAMTVNAGGDLGYTELQGDDRLDVTVAGQATGGSAEFVGEAHFAGTGSYDLSSVLSSSADVVAEVDGAFDVGTLRTPAGHIGVDAGSSAIADGAAAQTIDLVTRGVQDHGRLTAGGDLAATAGTEFHGYDLESVTGDIAITADCAAVEFGDALSEIHIDTTGDQSHGLLDPDAGGYLHADDLIELTAGGDISFRELRVGHDGDDPATGGDAVIRSEHGDIYGRLVKASRDIHLFALNGNLDLERLDYGGTYTLKAGRDLVAGIGGNFDSRDGEIRAGRNIEITTSGITGQAGDILLGGLVAETGHVHLDAAGDIRVAVASGGATPTSGAIEAGEEVYARAGGEISFENAVVAGGDVTLDAVDAVLVDVIESGGRQDIQAGGEFRFTDLTAGGGIDSRSGGNTEGGRVSSLVSVDMVSGLQGDGNVADADLLLDTVSAPQVRLRTADRLSVDRIEAGSQLWLQGGRIGSQPATGDFVATQIVHDGGKLAARATGGNGGLAETVDLWIRSGGELNFGPLYTAQGTIETTARRFKVADGWVGQWLYLDTAATELYMNNVTPALWNVDVQLYEPDTRFELAIDGLRTWTDAYVTHFRLGHQVVVPNASDDRQHGLDVGGISMEKRAEREMTRKARKGVPMIRPAMAPWMAPQPPQVDMPLDRPPVNLDWDEDELADVGMNDRDEDGQRL